MLLISRDFSYVSQLLMLSPRAKQNKTIIITALASDSIDDVVSKGNGCQGLSGKNEDVRMCGQLSYSQG